MLGALMLEKNALTTVIEFLRPELKFTDVPSLKQAMADDSARARAILARGPRASWSRPFRQAQVREDPVGEVLD